MSAFKIILINKLVYFHIAILFVSILTFSSCSKEGVNSILSSKSVFFAGDNNIYFPYTGLFIYNGSPGFYLRDTYKDGSVTRYKNRKIELNAADGKFSNSILKDIPIPEYTTRFTLLQQLKPGVNSFIVSSRCERFDSTFKKFLFFYRELHLMDKDNSTTRKFDLPDSTQSFPISTNKNIAKQMNDGRIVIYHEKGNTMGLTCFNENLKSDWTISASFASSSSFYFKDLLVIQNYIYLLYNGTNYFTVNQYDYNGQKKETYEISGSTNNLTVNQLIESKDGYFIRASKYVPEISEYDIHFSRMSTSNKLLSTHVLNIRGYLQDCNTETWNIANSYKSLVVKTLNGYAFAFTYPNNNNQLILCIVNLDENMKINSVKTIAKNDITISDFSELTLLNDGNQMVIMQKFNTAVYTYFLDNDGNLIKN